MPKETEMLVLLSYTYTLAKIILILSYMTWCLYIIISINFMTRFFIKYNATTKQYDGYGYDGNELLCDHRYSGLLMAVTIKVIIFLSCQ